LNNYKTIASLITDTNISPDQLLQQFISQNEDIYYESFRKFCADLRIIVEHDEFLNLLGNNKSYIFHEYADVKGRYWVPMIAEGYVSNSLPGDWDDFGDDQIDGITKPALGDGIQQQPFDFGPLSDMQSSDDPDSIQDSDDEIEPESEIDFPDFDTRIRHRPSRSVKELEGYEPDGRLIEYDQSNCSPLMSKLYGLVDSWQNGVVDQLSFEQELGKISSDPTLKNSNIDPWTIVQKILAIRK